MNVTNLVSIHFYPSTLRDFQIRAPHPQNPQNPPTHPNFTRDFQICIPRPQNSFEKRLVNGLIVRAAYRQATTLASY